MAFADLLPHTITILHPQEGAEDRYGNASEELVATGSSPGRVEMLSTGGAGRELLEDRDTRFTWATIYFPPDVTLDGLSVLDWEGRRFHVHGTPSFVYDATSLHHLEVMCREVEG